jgi:hypothetical protein
MNRLPGGSWGICAPALPEILTQFKIDFATSHHEFWLTNQTSQQSGFHSANMMIEQGHDESMQDTAEAIPQLAKAKASDRGTVATLNRTNAKLATQLEAAHALIAQLKNEIATLKSKIKPSWQGQRPVKTTTTTFIVGCMAIRWRNFTRVRHAT